MRKENIVLSEIEIPFMFKNSTPKKSKVDMKWGYYKKNGQFPRLVIRSDTKRLIDGYASYTAALEHGLKEAIGTVLTPKEAIVYNSKTVRKETPSKKKMILDKTKGVCYICKRKVYEKDDELFDGTNEFTIDHKIPLSKGGLNSLENLWPACNICNNLKGDFTYSKELKSLILKELKERNIM